MFTKLSPQNASSFVQHLGDDFNLSSFLIKYKWNDNAYGMRWLWHWVLMKNSWNMAASLTDGGRDMNTDFIFSHLNPLSISIPCWCSYSTSSSYIVALRAPPFSLRLRFPVRVPNPIYHPSPATVSSHRFPPTRLCSLQGQYFMLLSCGHTENLTMYAINNKIMNALAWFRKCSALLNSHTERELKYNKIV